LIAGAWAVALPFIPLVWYYVKSRAIKKCAASINKEFQSVGYDVESLLKEIPAIRSQQNDEQREHLENIKKKLIKKQEDAYRRKFGID
jgi:MinD-like ATPase involved in chromosome partitioning or flagellar assembly